MFLEYDLIKYDDAYKQRVFAFTDKCFEELGKKFELSGTTPADYHSAEDLVKFPTLTKPELRLWMQQEWDDHPEKCRETLVFDEGVWRRVVARCAEVGIDSVVVDVGDGVRLSGHPEIACRDA